MRGSANKDIDRGRGKSLSGSANKDIDGGRGNSLDWVGRWGITKTETGKQAVNREQRRRKALSIVLKETEGAEREKREGGGAKNTNKKGKRRDYRRHKSRAGE